MTENTVKYSENGFWIKKEADKYIVGLSEKARTIWAKSASSIFLKRAQSKRPIR